MPVFPATAPAIHHQHPRAIPLGRRFLGDQLLRQFVMKLRQVHCEPYSSLAPYSFSLLCRVFKLIPRISAAFVLLLFVCSSVLRISPFSASPTVVPIGTL